MPELPADLAAALDQTAGRLGVERLGTGTFRLIERYRADVPATPGRPIVAAEADAWAYAGYRMPATYAAVRAALARVPDEISLGRRHLDIAGGTGAAVWAVADRWPEVERQHVVLEQSAAAVAVGRRLVAGSADQAVRRTGWQPFVIDGEVAVPAAELITVAYLLGELEEGLRRRLLEAAVAAAGQLLVVVEPGTKAGYRRILTAREQVLGAGWSLVAPCPHEDRCPLQEQAADWCHFSARLARSGLHRRIKGAELNYEDEKFSYLIAAPRPVRHPAGRVLRHPRFAKGRVDLTVCRDTGDAVREVVAKRHHDLYRAARDTGWGDGWPPPD